MFLIQRSRQAQSAASSPGSLSWMVLCLSLLCALGLVQQVGANTSMVVGDRADSVAVFLAGPASLPELPRWRQLSAAFDDPFTDTDPDKPGIWLVGADSLLVVVPVIVRLTLAPAGAFFTPATRLLAGLPRGPPVLPTRHRRQLGIA